MGFSLKLVFFVLNLNIKYQSINIIILSIAHLIYLTLFINVLFGIYVLMLYRPVFQTCLYLFY